MKKILLLLAICFLSCFATFAEETEDMQEEEKIEIETIEQYNDSIQTTAAVENIEQNNTALTTINRGIIIINKNGHTYNVFGQIID